ncbi:glycosyltransferase family 61 protein [Kiloniella laminariae]|uniref:glycosyltransferase family 61 protein n=1 Tax=Kiloniella laminariae TaxID=454162 RepID=UPI00035D604C|nr:glycosyltransferase family 61 protein [Kiloniella laminariae]
MKRGKIHRTPLTETTQARREYPVNISAADEGLFQEATEQTIPASELLEIEDAVVLGNGWLWSNNSVVREAFNPFRMPDAKKKRIKGKLRLWLSSLHRSKAVSGLWVSDVWSYNYYHWLTDTIPRLYLAREQGVNAQLYLPKICLKPKFIPESLKLLGEEQPLYISQSIASIRFGKLFLPTYAGEVGNNHGPTIRAVAEKFRRSWSKSSPPKRRVYISRKLAPNRLVQNEDEILPVLEKFGFEAISFETLSFTEQVELAASCEMIVGPHGAGMTNIMFMPEGGKVIELHPQRTELNTCYFNLSHVMHHSYQYLIAESIDDKSNMMINPASLEECLSRVLSLS